MSFASTGQYVNWPDSLQSKLPYRTPPKNNNPSVRGLVLSIGASLVEKIGLISNFLYNNAGFNALRKVKALEDVKHRFDPTVVPIATPEEQNATSPNYTDPATESRTLLKRLEAGAVPLFWGVRDYHDAYKSGQLTPIQVVNGLLPLIRRDINDRREHSTAFITTKVDIVISAAEASTKRWASGKPLGLLDGVPIAVKDEVDLAGYPLYYGSRKLFRESKETSWCAAKWEEAGAIMLGKTNMHEVGMDTTNNNSAYGTPKNPYNDRYYTGGSSGGSGYIVSTGLVPFALGCDGGGSIRIPSCYCGIFGLKPSHSRVSDRPSPDVAGTTTVAGPMASSMESLEIAYHVMATPDPNRHASASFPVPRRLSAPRKKIIGVPRQWFNQADPSVREACENAVDWYGKACGYQVIDINIPLTIEGQIAHALTIMLEARNGFSDTSFLQPANRILMAVASCCPTTDFLSAQKVRQIIMQHLGYLFDTHGHDLIIVTPTTPNAGWSFEPADLKSGISDGDMTIKNMTYVWLANFCGNPALQFPVGFAEPVAGTTGNVPVGLMGMGVWGGEEGLIEWGYEGEKYLHEVLEGGRLSSPKWINAIKLAKDSDKKPTAPETTSTTNGTADAEHKVATAAPAPAPAPAPAALDATAAISAPMTEKTDKAVETKGSTNVAKEEEPTTSASVATAS